MKREYKLSSLILVMLLSSVLISITSWLFFAIAGNSLIMTFVGQFLLMILSLIFQFALCSGLLRNRMGSVGEYLNQVNYINGKIILINIIVQIVITFIVTLVTAFGGAFLFITLIDAQPTTGTFAEILVGILIVAFAVVYSLLTSYSNFYMADFLVDSYRDIGLFEAIKNIFKVGKDLMGKTFMVYLKAAIFPIVLLISMVLLARSNFGMGTAFIFTLIIIAMLIYTLVIGGIVLARISDLYLDYMEVNRSKYLK